MVHLNLLKLLQMNHVFCMVTSPYSGAIHGNGTTASTFLAKSPTEGLAFIPNKKHLL